MANLADKSGDAYSNIVQGTGTATATFVMPGTVPLAVSSVVATVDNTAGGDTRATLVIRDQAGEVIATKRQGAVIPAGDTGTATWALRLDDELALPVRQAVVFDFVSTAVAPHDGQAIATVFGYTRDTPHYESQFSLTLPLIAAIGTVIEISYSNNGPGTAIISFPNIVLTNLTTGQTEGISSASLPVPSGTFDFVSWDAHISGAALLDRTFPKSPNFAVGGNYVITANGTVDFV